MLAEWVHHKKPTVLGIVSGAVAGLVAITPGSGFVAPAGALAIGMIASVVCYWGVVWLKEKSGYDDSLDVFGIHGLGGIGGAILTGVFAVEAVGGKAGALEGNVSQIGLQAYGIVATMIWSAVATAAILFIIDKAIGLRVDHEDELQGLDLSQHGETLR
jgi:Amt family ammonium transporter